MASKLEGLASWEDADADVFAAAARVAEHRGFPAASRALATGMLALSAGDRVLDEIFKDAGRYFAAMWGLALHEDGGLTLPRLKTVCARSGLLSPGRARALLRFLEHFAYLERRRPARGPDVYIPTAAYLAAWDRQLVTALLAAEAIAPDIGGLLHPLAAASRQAYGRIHATGLMAVRHTSTEVSSFLRIFLHPYAGSQILRILVASPADPEFPPRFAGPVSMAGLARSCRVGRSQVTRIFREAEDEGLVSLDAAGFVRFSEPAREQLSFFYAVQFVPILAAAARATRADATGAA